MRLKRNLIPSCSLLALACASFLPFLSANAETIVSTAAFNTSGSQNADGYTAYVESSSNAFTWETAGGTGNPASGGLKATVTSSQTSRRSSTVRKTFSTVSSAVESWETSLDFRFDSIQDLTTSWREAELWLGFSGYATAPSTSSDSSHAYLSSRAESLSVKVMGAYNPADTNTQNNVKVTLVNAGTESASLYLQNQASFFSHWMRITLRLVRGTGNTYTASFRLEDIGTDGTATPTLINQSADATYTNAGLGAATTTYGAFAMATRTRVNVTPKAALLTDNHKVTVVTATPLAPTALDATAKTTTRLSANWQAPATGPLPQNYVLELVKAEDAFESGKYISATGTTAQTAGITVASTVTSQAFQGLVRNQAYKYRVRATNVAGGGPNSEVISTTTLNVNTPPTLDLITPPLAFFPGDVQPRQIALSGISTGGDDDQTFSVSISSSNQAVVADAALSLSAVTNGGATLTLTPAGGEGSAIITVTVKDFTGGIEEGQISRSFPVRAQQPIVTSGFDTSDDLAQQYGQGVSSNIAVGWNATAGAGNPASGGIQMVKTGSSNGFYNGWRPQAISLDGKTLAKTSVLINLKDFTASGTASYVYLGFARHTADGVPSGNPATLAFLQSGSNYRGVSTSLSITSSSNGTLSLQTQNKASTSNSTAGSSAASRTLVNTDGTKNSWLRLSLELSPSGTANEYHAITTVENLGADGTSTATRLLTYTAKLVNADMFGTNAAAVYPCYNTTVSTSATGTIRLDDHLAETKTGPSDIPVALPPTGITIYNFTVPWTAAEFGPYPAAGFVLTAIKVTDPQSTGHIGTLADGPYLQADGTFGPTPITVSAPTTTSLAFAGLERGTAYHYHVRSSNAAGQVSAPSNVIETASSAVNMLPTLQALTSPASFHPGDTAIRTVSLAGISNGGDGNQAITITITSDNPAVVPNPQPTLVYTSPNPTGTFTYTPTGTAGTAVITVRVSDGENFVERSFTVQVRPPPASYGFDTGDEAATEYSYAVSASTIGAAWAANAGTGSTPGGGIVISKTATSTLTLAGWRQQTFDLRNKTFIGTSVLINPREWTGTSTTTGTVRLGFVSGAVPTGTTFFNTGTSYRAFYVQMVHDAGTNNRFALQLYNKSSTGSSATLGTVQYVTGAATLKANWLRLSTNIIPTSVGGTTYTARLRLENMGVDGTAAPQILAEASIALTNADLAAASSAYAAYDVATNSANTGKTYLDDHQAVASATVPVAPVALEAELLVRHAFTARWNRPENSAVDSYTLEISKASDNFAPGTLVDADGNIGNLTGIELDDAITSLRVIGLSPSTAYVYRIIASNQIGKGLPSNVIAVTTPAATFNLPPTLNEITAQAQPVAPNSGKYTVNLSGITDGGEGNQTLTITATSSNETVVLVPEVVNYNAAAGTAQIIFEPDTLEGAATLTVTINDGWATNNLFSRTFTVTVRQPPEVTNFNDSQSDLLSEFIQPVQSRGTLAWTATGGLSGTGGLQLTYSGDDASHLMSAWRSQPYNLKDKTYLETSILIKPSGWEEKEKRERFYLGFAHGNAETDFTNGFLYSGAAAGLSASLISSIEDNQIHFGLGNKAANGTVAISSEQTLTGGSTYRTHWLRIRLVLLPSLTPGAYDATATLESLGTTGTSEPVVLSTRTGTLTNAAVFTSEKALAGFTTYKSEKENGTIYLDDHKVIVRGGVPDAPTALAGNIILSNAFTARWTAPPASAPDGYILEVSTDAAFAPGTFVSATGAHNQAAGITLPRTASSQRLNGLQPGTSYWYRVVAFNEYGNSLASNVETVSTLGVGINAPPTLSPLTFVQPGISPDSGPHTVTFTGITDGGEGGQTLQVTATSSNPTIVAHPVVSYASPAADGTLVFYAGAVPGTATITVTVNDGAANNNTVSQTFNVLVRQPPQQLNFNEGENQAAEFALLATSGTSLAQSNTGGVGGQGGLEIRKASSGSNTAASWRRQPYSMQDKSELTTSVMINPASWNNVGNGGFYLGFASNGGAEPAAAAHFMNTGTTYRGISLFMNYYAGIKSGEIKYTQTLQFSLRNKSSTGTSALVGTTSQVSSPNSATAGNLMTSWLKLTLKLVRSNTAGGFVGEWTLENLGTAGTSEPVEVLRQSNLAFTNADLAASPAAYAAFTMNSSGGSLPFQIDNHEVKTVSEPPKAPVILPATLVTSIGFTANWAPAEGIYGLSGYRLEVSSSSDFSTLVDATGATTTQPIIVPAGTLSKHISGLTPGTSYYYRLQGYFASQISAYTETNGSAVTSPAGQNQAPGMADLAVPQVVVLNTAGAQTYSITGIHSGGEFEPLTLTVSSGQTDVVPAPVWTSSSSTPVSGQGTSSLVIKPEPGTPATATLQFTPAASKTGTVEITVQLSDGTRQVTKNFIVEVREPVTFFNAGNATKGAAATGSIWKYFDNGTDLGDAWRVPAYDDAGWLSGPATLGYDTGDSNALIATPVSYGTNANTKFITTYFRSHFAVASPADAKALAARVRFDDAVAVYVNGTQVYRSTNLPATAAYNTLATANGDPAVWQSFSINPNVLVTGDNLIAVEVHQSALTSSDLYLDFELKGELLPTGGPGLSNPVTALPATHITSDGFTAHWGSPPLSTPSFVIEVSKQENFSEVDTITIANGNTRLYRYEAPARAVTASTTYYYRVKAINDAAGTFANAVSLRTLAVGQNSLPTVDVIADVNVAVSAGSTSVPLTGITTGGEFSQWVETVTVTTDKPSLFSSLGLNPAWDKFAFAETATLRFTPATGVQGFANVTVTVKDDGATPNTFSRTFRVTIGTPPLGPVLAVQRMPGETALTSPASLTFADTIANQNTTQTLRLRNTGDAAITGLAVNITGTQAAAFTKTSLTSTTLAPGASADVTVTFTPSAAAAYAAELRVTGTNAPASPFVVNLSGTGLPLPPVPLLTVSLMPAETALSNPSALSFPSTVVGLSSTRVVRLRSAGTAAITGLALSVSGNDAASFTSSELASSTLAPGEYADITLTFTPESAGTLTAAVQVASTNAPGSPFILNLSAVGKIAPVGPSLAVLLMPEETELTSPADLTFPSSEVGQFATRTLRLSSDGTDPVTGLALALSGADAAAFSVSALEPTELAAGSHVDVTVRFAPQAVGDLVAALAVTSTNALQEPFTLNLTGTAFEADPRNVRPLDLPVTEATPAESEDIEAWRASIVGTYDGLLRDTTDTARVLGAISKLTVAKPAGTSTTGAVSGTLLVDGRSIRLSGKFAADGTLDLSTSGFSILLKIEETGVTDGEVLTGTATWDGASAQVRLPKAITSAAAVAGTYTLVLPSKSGWGETAPGGDGWATATILANGTVSMTGVLGDGTTFTETAYVSADGEFSIYVPLYAKSPIKGWLGGSLKLRDIAGVSDFDGRLHWIKSATPKDVRYPAGFDLQPWAIGSRYVAPATGQRAIAALANQDYNAIVSLIGMDAQGSIGEKVVSWSSANKVMYYGPDVLTATLTAKTGLLTTKYEDKPNKKAALSGKAVVFQKQGRAAGNFLYAQGAGATRIIPGTAYEYPGSETPDSIPVATAPGTPAEAEVTEEIAWDVLSAGTYAGVLSNGTGSLQEGSLESLVLTNKGAFTATLWIRGVRYQLKGTVDAEGQLQLASVAPVTAGLALDLHLAKVTDGAVLAYHVEGGITLGADSFTLNANRRPTFTGTQRSASEGLYTLAVLQGTVDGDTETLDAAPFGDGYASLKVDAKGLCTGALVLSDGTKTTFAGHVSIDGAWNFYRALYTNKGWLGGRIVFRSTEVADLDGSWRWVKNVGIAKTPSYADGIDTVRQVTGSKFVKPEKGVRALPGLTDGNYNVRLHLPAVASAGSPQASPVLASVSHALSWTLDNKVLYYGPQAVKLTFNAATGLVTGTYTDTARGLKLTVGGALLQKQSLVTGFHAAGTAKFGGFVLEPR